MMKKKSAGRSAAALLVALAVAAVLMLGGAFSFAVEQKDKQPDKKGPNGNPVVDTGQNKFYDNLKQIPPPKPGEPFYGQDAQYKGVPSKYRDNKDGTVTDLRTGLIWQRGSDGKKRDWGKAMEYAKSLRLAGHGDWRLPTVKELYSLIDYGRGWPYMDTRYFQCKLDPVDARNTQYWSCTRYAGKLTPPDDKNKRDAAWQMGPPPPSGDRPDPGPSDEDGDQQQPPGPKPDQKPKDAFFSVNFATGHIRGCPGPMGNYVRCVRGKAYGRNDLVDNGDGTVTDKATGLMWQKADDGTARNWKDALAYAEGLTLASHDDWRLPNAKELHSIVDYSKVEPAINPIFSTTDKRGWYWTSTTATIRAQAQHAFGWCVAFGKCEIFGSGSVLIAPKSDESPKPPEPKSEIKVNNYARCVRNAFEAKKPDKPDEPKEPDYNGPDYSRTCGTSSIGVTELGKTWYLAEGATAGGFDTWVLVQNPGEEAANVTLTYMTKKGEVAGPSLELAAKSRASVRVADTVRTFHVSTKVTSDQPVVAERSMYFTPPGRDIHLDGTSSIGVTELGKTWYLAEGATAGGFETWVLVQNPGDEAANVALTFMTKEGEVAGPNIEVAAKSRESVRVDDTVKTFNVSTRVVSDQLVVAERSVYFRPPRFDHFACAASSIGVTELGKTWYLAEGATAGGFDTWVLVQNPGDEAANVALTFMTKEGVKAGPTLELAAKSRASVRVADTVRTFHVSTKVTSDQPVVSEVSVYFWPPDRPHPKCATCSIGVTEPAETWYLAEGATAGGFETWVLVQNPGDEAANVALTFMTNKGVVAGPTIEVAAKSRASVHVDDTVRTFHVSTKVVSDKPVIGERSVYKRTRGPN